jgi:hypothetical protein
MPAYDQRSRAGNARSPRQTRRTQASAPYTSSLRQTTSGNAGSVMSFPRMAVKPHSSTQKWICRNALRLSAAVIGRRSSGGGHRAAASGSTSRMAIMRLV